MSKPFQSIRRGLGGFGLVVLLCPVLWAMGRTLWVSFGKVWLASKWVLWPYAAGTIGYILLERLAFFPLRLYVFGHELTHALSCALSGGRVYDFHASPRGGHVKLSKTGVWIALSPYCVPLYTIFLLLGSRVLGIWWDLNPYAWVLQMLLGASLAFHVSLTVFALKCHQPDLEVLGWLPSLTVILFSNGLCLALLLAFLFPKAIEAGEITKVFGVNLKSTVFHIVSEIASLWQRIWTG